MSRDLSLGLDIAKQGVLSYSNRVNHDTENLSVAGALCGRKSESFVTTKNFSDATSVAVISKPIIYIDQPGSIFSSSVSTNFAIGGKGFTVVKDLGENQFFTRVGTFTLDKDKFLSNHLGQVLQGVSVDKKGQETLPVLGALVPIQVGNNFAPAQATSSISMKLALPVGAENGKSFSQNVPIINNAGEAKILVFNWKKKDNNNWSLDITAGNGITLSQNYKIDNISFDSKGVLKDFNGNNILEPISVTFDGGDTKQITLDLGTPEKTNGLMLSGNDFSLKNFNADGYKTGKFLGVSIDEQGYVTSNFSNGVQKVIARIPLADFNNVNGLDPINNGSYTTSQDSGEAILNFPGEESMGSLLSSNLEGSNINQTQAYVDMIQDEQRYTNNISSLSTIRKMIDRFNDIFR
jgi:flagellar hook protein FlgE